MEILTAEQSYLADRLTIAAGTPGYVLMRTAGRRVVEAICERYTARPVLVLCGPGNNGGDGYVIARLLREAGWEVQLAAALPEVALRGDAEAAQTDWHAAGGETAPFDPAMLETSTLLVDALFGVGLCRPIEGRLHVCLTACNAWAGRPGHAVIAVDIASGLNADSGEVLGVALKADITVTFFRPKWGHFRGSGPTYSGELVIADIGIPDTVLAALGEPGQC